MFCVVLKCIARHYAQIFKKADFNFFFTGGYIVVVVPDSEVGDSFVGLEPERLWKSYVTEGCITQV